MTRLIWVCFCIFSVFLYWQFNGLRTTQLKVASQEVFIPYKDKRQIEYLLREFVVYDAAGYTLFGDKPISFQCVFKPAFKWDIRFLWHTFFPSNLKRYYAWKTWQKYDFFSNQKDFLIWSEPSPWIENGMLLIIANKKKTEQIFEEHRQYFASLGELPSQLAHAEDVKCLFRQCLQSHEGLLGILLGYGQNNAFLFHQKHLPLLQPIFAEELDHLFQNRNTALNFTFGWPSVPMEEMLMYPTFMVDPKTVETENLRSKYLNSRKSILEYYKGKDFLEATLDLLSQEPSKSS